MTFKLKPEEKVFTKPSTPSRGSSKWQGMGRKGFVMFKDQKASHGVGVSCARRPGKVRRVTRSHAGQLTDHDESFGFFIQEPWKVTSSALYFVF